MSKERSHRHGQDHVIDIEQQIHPGAIIVVDEQGGVYSGLHEPKRSDVRDEALEPRLWCLIKAVEGMGQEADVVWPCWIGETGGLLAAPGRNALETSSWCAGQPLLAMSVSTVRMVDGLITGEKVFLKSMPGH